MSKKQKLNLKLGITIPAFRSPLESYKKYLVPALIILLAIGLALAVWFGFRYKQAQSEIKYLKQGDAAKQQTKELLEEVGKLVVLPTDEEPTIATVTDLEKLKDQVFFAKAAVGDKVLIYTKAKKAILYRPSDNKIIEIAPLNIGESGQTPTTSQVDSKSTVTITVLNGSGTAGRAASGG